MIKDVGRSHPLRKFDTVGSRCRRKDDRQFEDLSRDLVRNSAYTTRAIDDEEGSPLPLLISHRSISFVGGEVSQGHSSGLGHVESFRFVAHTALINELKFCIGTMSERTAGIEDLVSCLKERTLGTDRDDCPGTVVATDLIRMRSMLVVIWKCVNQPILEQRDQSIGFWDKKYTGIVIVFSSTDFDVNRIYRACLYPVSPQKFSLYE